MDKFGPFVSTMNIIGRCENYYNFFIFECVQCFFLHSPLVDTPSDVNSFVLTRTLI